MDLKSVLIGLICGCSLLLLLGARPAPQPAPVSDMQSEIGRYQLTTQKTVQGTDYWTIFDTVEGVAKIFKDGSVHVVSFPENVSEKLK